MPYIRLIIIGSFLIITAHSADAGSLKDSFFKKDRNLHHSVHESNKSEIKDYKTKARARIKASKELGKRRMYERRQRQNSLFMKDLHADIAHKGKEAIRQIKAPKIELDIDVNDEAHSKMDDVIFKNEHTKINSDEKISNSWKHRAKRIKKRLMSTDN